MPARLSAPNLTLPAEVFLEDLFRGGDVCFGFFKLVKIKQVKSAWEMQIWNSVYARQGGTRRTACSGSCEGFTGSGTLYHFSHATKSFCLYFGFQAGSHAFAWAALEWEPPTSIS
jgi:hypothetical protein